MILPPLGSFELQATAERGEVVNDYGPPIEKETEGRTSTLKSEIGQDPILRITANPGSVSVRKEGMMPSEVPKTKSKDPVIL